MAAFSCVLVAACSKSRRPDAGVANDRVVVVVAKSDRRGIEPRTGRARDLRSILSEVQTIQSDVSLECLTTGARLNGNVLY